MDHVHEHAGHAQHHGHEHEHEHAHGHGHSHDAREYYLEQLLSILICGLFGLVAVLMSRTGMLDILLAPSFHSWVLFGGIALLAITVIRGVSLWRAAGTQAHAHAHGASDHHQHQHGEACDHDHKHGEECGHDHDHAHGHDHPHGSHDGHSHGNIYWRVVVLAFPLLLFGMGLPNKGFSEERIKRMLGTPVELGDVKAVDDRGGPVLTFDFAELNATSNDPGKRAEYEGKRARVKGQLTKVTGTQYTLYRLKMNCCAADQIALTARIITDAVTQFNNNEWVTVEGVLQFVQMPGKSQYVPVIRVKDLSKIQSAPAE